MKLFDIVNLAKNVTPKKKVAVAVAEEDVIIKAISDAVANEVCEAILFGNKEVIEKIAVENSIDISKLEIRDYKNKNEAIKATVEAISKGEADLPMKGKITTGELLSVFLKEEYGLKTKATMNLVSVFEVPTLDRLLIVSDAGMVIAPTFEQKIDSINNSVKVAHKIGLENPKVAILAALEQVNPKMPVTTDAALITQMNVRGQIKGCVVDGPLSMDLAISEESVKHKGITGEVPGHADVLIMPDIEAGNIFYKSMVFLGNAKVASTILGGKKPVVLTSRADSDETKMLSIALSVLLS